MTNTHPIVFGTDGWRGVIADDFTFDNLAIVAEAAARYFKRHQRKDNGVIIGYDARFMSGDFAAYTAEVLGNRGIRVYLADAIATTPMVSLAIAKRKAAGGIVITASHNPPRYNGFKLKEAYGGPAHPEYIERLENHVRAVIGRGVKKPRTWKRLEQLRDEGIVTLTDLAKLYTSELRKKIDIDTIGGSKIRIVFDAMYGAGAGVPGTLIDSIMEIRGAYNPSFGGANPEPIQQNLGPLVDTMKSGGSAIGIATDGDGDRVAAVDEKGRFVDSHRIFALLVKYLYEQKGLRGDVVKSVSVTELIDKMCARYSIPLHITPVGFKHICRHMVDGDVLVGGEESGGIGVKNYIPERDGIFNGLLLCEMMAVREKKLSDLVEELMEEYGYHHYNRIDLHVGKKEQPRIIRAFEKAMRSRGGMDTIAGYPIRRRDNLDGYKFFLDSGWLLVRSSGTEPLIRYYAEADTPEKVDKMLRFATSV
jgi:phosphomannomutase